MVLWSTQTNGNEYQEYFRERVEGRCKGSWCVGLQSCYLHVPIVLKSGSLSLMEPSQPVHACRKIALSLSLSLTYVRMYVCMYVCMYVYDSILPSKS
jgi:hypothetical protein